MKILKDTRQQIPTSQFLVVLGGDKTFLKGVSANKSYAKSRIFLILLSKEQGNVIQWSQMQNICDKVPNITG